MSREKPKKGVKKIKNIFADYNLMSPDDMNALIFNAYSQSLGKETRERIRKQLDNYLYYEGRQHRNEYGELVKASELDRPAGLDYDPTRYATNYFKAIIDRKARWQMGGKHGISVPRRQIDDVEMTLAEDYVPSEAQRAENERAENYERLLYQLWDENRMRAKLVQAARDRLIADRVVCKIVYNQQTGKLRWLFRPDTEYVPVYSDDDFEDLIAAHFVKPIKYDFRGEEIDALQIQTFRLEGGETYLREAIYREDDLRLLATITPETTMGLDFIPVQEFPVNELITETLGESEISALREQNDVLNQMNEDAIDSLKFEMFEILAITNAAPGAADNIQVAPSSVVEIQSAGESKAADIKKVSGNFGWKEAFKDQYARVKGAMHEISGLLQIVQQEPNVGWLNEEALQVLFHDIITDTEEHWLSWGYNLAELHEKSIRYLQARIHLPTFGYDKQTEASSSDTYENETRLVLQLPDTRNDNGDLVDLEVEAGT